MSALKCTHPGQRVTTPPGRWRCPTCIRQRRGSAERAYAWPLAAAFLAEWGIITPRDLAGLTGTPLVNAGARLREWANGSRGYPALVRRVGRGVYARLETVQEAAE